MLVEHHGANENCQHTSYSPGDGVTNMLEQLSRPHFLELQSPKAIESSLRVLFPILAWLAAKRCFVHSHARLMASLAKFIVLSLHTRPNLAIQTPQAFPHWDHVGGDLVLNLTTGMNAASS